MICSKCKEMGQKSTISGGSGYRTAMYFAPYYDEDGKYHYHNGNICTSHYTCSKGHSIKIIDSSKCPSCDFGHEQTITVEDKNDNFITIKPN